MASPRAADEALPAAGQEALFSKVWIDRDLSWMEFNRRVLAEALDDRRRCSNAPSFSPFSRPTSTSSS
jgi:hypothetical protein